MFPDPYKYKEACRTDSTRHERCSEVFVLIVLTVFLSQKQC